MIDLNAAEIGNSKKKEREEVSNFLNFKANSLGLALRRERQWSKRTLVKSFQ